MSTAIQLSRVTPQPVAVEIVARDEAARSAAVIETRKLTPTATGAASDGIGFIRQPSFWVSHSVLGLVMKAGCHDFEVLGPIVEFVTVPMVDNFAFSQPPTAHGLGDHAVLIDVAATEGGRVLRAIDLHIAIRGHSPSAFPVRPSHVLSLAHGVLHRKEVMPYA